MRVEWFRGRERYKRWEEEEKLLRREMASVILDFSARSQAWDTLATSQHAGFNQGYAAYCKRQRDIWHELREDVSARCKAALMVR